MRTWIHKIIKNKQLIKKPYYLWKLLWHQIIQKIDKAKTSIYPTFPIWTLFQSNQKLEEMFFFIDEKVKNDKHKNDRNGKITIL